MTKKAYTQPQRSEKKEKNGEASHFILIKCKENKLLEEGGDKQPIIPRPINV